MSRRARRIRRADERARRWQARPILSTTLRVIVAVMPILVGVVTAVLASRMVPRPNGLGPSIGWWALLMACPVFPVLVCERLMRRLLPLVVLLKLTMLFPGAAPSRLAIARRAGRVRDLKKQLETARATGSDQDLADAAEAILGLIAALGSHDRGTRGHSERVRMFTDLLAEELGLGSEERDRLRWAALLHDVGKMHVSQDLLNKPGRPTPEEWAVIHRHPIEGMEVAAPLLPWFGPWSGAIEHHHERFDGTGYPHGIAGRDISLAGRILSIADSYETMTATRPYKKPLSAGAARTELTRCAGKQFDPELVRAFLNVSIGKLWRTIGLASLAAQVPLVAGLSMRGIPVRFHRRVAAVASTAAMVAGLGAGGVLGPLDDHLSSSLATDASTAATTAPSLGVGRIPIERPPAERPEPGESKPPSRTIPTAFAGNGDHDPATVALAHDVETPSDGATKAENGQKQDRDREPHPPPYRDEGWIVAFTPPIGRDGITRSEFLATCDIPTSQGIDGWVFTVPDTYSEGGVVGLEATNALGLYQVALSFFSSACEQLATLGDRSSLPPGTAFVLVDQHAGANTVASLSITEKG